MKKTPIEMGRSEVHAKTAKVCSLRSRGTTNGTNLAKGRRGVSRCFMMNRTQCTNRLRWTERGQGGESEPRGWYAGGGESDDGDRELRRRRVKDGAHLILGISSGLSLPFPSFCPILESWWSSTAES